MKKKLLCGLIAALILTFALSTLVGCDKKSTKPDDNLIFFDDFNTLNTNIWNIHSPADDEYEGYGNINGIRRGGYWDRKQVFTQDGNLVIRTEQRDGKYYTGAIDSYGKYERHFGYYETRCYFPEAYGIWSAFWIMCKGLVENPSTDAKVSGAEIDIVESPYYMPEEDLQFYQCAVHTGGYGEGYSSVEYLSFLNPNAGRSFYGDWHTFAVDWQEDYYRFYADDVLIIEMTGNYTGGISNVDGYLYLSVEIGGNDGIADNTPFFAAPHKIQDNADGTLPVDFLVDYVKIYKQKP